ncbi:TPA: fimbrial assembly chaperone [Klebsiella quasipneumoniae]|uniref:fimbrial assembly chaperone n=1 Tax=Klebsiella quasipneumoniae TaxID=1463165 RepID=UPI0013FAF270|nr:fimbrial assembly chaperone [Klebsiella quasipneumoniae]NGX12391.1 fimbrial assembly chaperone [Klebsiella quasipneumoniae]NGX19397.1 fimbrial assembly chaperone [Klebsiella quasipneumoniae]NGX23691.1 fimbrial assembly chaperone [Klebsiella quasipneumoniae]
MNRLLCLVCFFFSISVSQASVVVGGTRVIFDGTKKTTTVSVQNKDNVTNIVQSWLAIVDETSPAKDSFITTPPLFRLKAGEKGFVRILHTGKPMPEDRESMLWLNIKGIPATDDVSDKNIVQFAINSRIKLIYRPAALKNAIPEEFAQKLQWSNDGRAINVKNDSPLYMNFSEIFINGKAVPEAWFVAPYSTIRIPVANASPAGKKEITWSVINDYGMSGPKYKAIIQ